MNGDNNGNDRRLFGIRQQERQRHQIIFVSGDSPPLLADSERQPSLKVRVYGERNSAGYLSNLPRKYDIIQTAMFEANTTALRTLVPLNLPGPESWNRLTTNEDGPTC